MGYHCVYKQWPLFYKHRPLSDAKLKNPAKSVGIILKLCQSR